MVFGGENLFAAYTDGQPSFYLVSGWAFDTWHSNMPFSGMLTIGAGSGRFSGQTLRDVYEGKGSNATGLFGSLAWEAKSHLNFITECNGRNLNAGLA